MIPLQILKIKNQTNATIQETDQVKKKADRKSEALTGNQKKSEEEEEAQKEEKEMNVNNIEETVKLKTLYKMTTLLGHMLKLHTSILGERGLTFNKGLPKIFFSSSSVSSDSVSSSTSHVNNISTFTETNNIDNWFKNNEDSIGSAKAIPITLYYIHLIYIKFINLNI